MSLSTTVRGIVPSDTIPTRSSVISVSRSTSWMLIPPQARCRDSADGNHIGAGLDIDIAPDELGLVGYLRLAIFQWLHKHWVVTYSGPQATTRLYSAVTGIS